MKSVHYQQHSDQNMTHSELSEGLSNPNLASGPVQSTAKRLRFTTGDIGREQDPTEALTAMAQGQLRTAVTGEAFELLLQLPDESALYAVMQNVVVFARMKPHQKGQVMQLLGLRGLHQRCHGGRRHLSVSKRQAASTVLVLLVKLTGQCPVCLCRRKAGDKYASLCCRSLV